MKKLIPILLSVFIQVVAGAIIIAIISMVDPILFAALIDERMSGRSQRFALDDLQSGLIIVFAASAGLAVLASLVWLVFASLKVVHHPKDVPTLSPFWVANTLVFIVATGAAGYYLTGRFAYGLRPSYTVHVVMLGLLAFVAFYYPATFFATRPTMRPAVLFRNRLFARSQA